MSTDTGTARGGAAPFVLPLYTLTLFLSAFLLFAVQPMFTKMVLPLLGGSAAVWNTAVVFFQATLLLGYAYAHFSTKWLGPKQQTILHGLVLLIGFVCLPIGVADWTPPTGETQIPWLIGLLAVSIGLPFFAVSATAPLLQKWFAHTDHAAAGDPYFLYGGSNLGSLAALLSYPLLVEPVLGLKGQGTAWTLGYALLGAAIATCGVILVRRFRTQEASGAPSDEQGLVADVTWKLRVRWLALSTVPSALLLGVTLHIGTDVASMPFLWVLPLALYLLTFVFVFARRQLVGPKWWLRGQILLVALVTVLYQTPSLYLLLGLHVGAMFFTSMVCHGELARLRPQAKHLTEFYLWMSIGGVVGGFLSAIVAPLVFDGVYEYPLALFAALLLRPRSPGAKPAPWRWVLDVGLAGLLWFVLSRGWIRTGIQTLVANALDIDLQAVTPEQGERLITTVGWIFSLVVAVLLLLLATRPLRFGLSFAGALFVLAPDVVGNPEYRLTRERSFFGVYSVNRVPTEVGVFHFLQNGTTNHGGQNMDRPLGPVTYYTREGPVGQFFGIVKSSATPARRIGVIGLGVGAVVAHLGRDQHMTFFEIDPVDERLARDPNYFKYLAEAGDKVDVVIGDGRLALAHEPDGAFDALLVDAFSSDAIPIHLMTREALALYFQKLSPNGLLMLHITNVYLDLLPIVGNLVADAGLHARASIEVMPTITPGGAASDWVVVGRTKEALARFSFTNPPWTEVAPDPRYDVWTDDSSNVLQVLKWEGYGVIR